MPITTTPATVSRVTRVRCPKCRTKVWGVGFLPDSCVQGMTYRCKRCGSLWNVTVVGETKNELQGGEETMGKCGNNCATNKGGIIKAVKTTEQPKATVTKGNDLRNGK